jgi:hypothetical protein
MNTFDDITDALENYWRLKLGADVHHAWQDERYVTKEDRKYPYALLSILDTPIDSSRASAVPENIVSVDTTAGVARIEKPPVPIDLEFQLDVLSGRKTDANNLSEKALLVLGTKVKDQIVTESGKKVYLSALPGSITPPEIDSAVWRTAHRFVIKTWLTSVEYREVNIVLSRILEINGKAMEA